MAEVENANVSEDGKLVSLMQASSSTVKKDRANQVLNNVHTSFKQKIDAVFNNINELKIKQGDLLHKLVPKNVMDISFDNINTLEFVDKDIAILKDLLNEEIWFEGLKNEYRRLFGKDYVEPEAFLA